MSIVCWQCLGTGDVKPILLVCDICHGDGFERCVSCDERAVATLDGDPLCQTHHDELACGECGERHPTVEHLPHAMGW